MMMFDKIVDFNFKLKSTNKDTSYIDLFQNNASRPGVPGTENDFFTRLAFNGDTNPYCFDWLDIVEKVTGKKNFIPAIFCLILVI